MTWLKRYILWCGICFIACPPESFAQAEKMISQKNIPFPLYWENKPLYYEISDNSVMIVAGPKTDMFRDPNVTYNTDNAPKLLFRPDTDFVFSTSINHAFVGAIPNR